MTLNPQVKLLFDVLPLAVFFAGFKWGGLYAATTGLIIVTVIILAITYFLERRIALAPLITAIVVGIFGGLTLWLKDETFIKMKPTLVNIVFAVILLVGCVRRKGYLKSVLGTAFNLSERGWYLLSMRWAFFFLAMAALNEYVWRHYPTNVWVNFKVFGLIGLTVVFALSQTRFVHKHQAEDNTPIQ